jgi:hypothetical protein
MRDMFIMRQDLQFMNFMRVNLQSQPSQKMLLMMYVLGMLKCVCYGAVMRYVSDVHLLIYPHQTHPLNHLLLCENSAQISPKPCTFG